MLVLIVSYRSCKLEIALINEAIASFSRDIGWCSVPSTIGSIFPIVIKTTLRLNFSALVSIHHIAALEGLLLLESWIVILALLTDTFLGFLSVLSVLSRCVLPWKRVDVRRENSIVCVSFFALDEFALTLSPSHFLSRLDAIETHLRTREGRNR